MTVDLTNGGKGVDATGLGLTGATVTGADAPAAITNATAALALVQTAISNLGIVQGAVGAGENLLNYATSLANSQITNLTASESSIKDANVAAEASEPGQGADPAAVFHRRSGASQLHAGSDPEAAAVDSVG